MRKSPHSNISDSAKRENNYSKFMDQTFRLFFCRL